MGKKYIISIDLGTTGNRVYCFDESGLPLASSYREFTQHFPKPGWVEHDPSEIWLKALKTTRTAIESAKIEFSEIAGIGITNQRE